ncbi:hypothetical protein CYY_000817 [Polysphondylium violaceum]|uniref:Uncharacterized protein n=1 Tax=Polysphondylium violaceum TaxID=133409 RepID=A0A8J4Q231_9MYCE|nr:hypothetical protein CYY_000817 [Polysphondylium violaceum]
MKYLQLYRQYQDLHRKSNADLATSIVKLKSLNDNGNYLQVSLISLDIVKKTMGKVKTTFENTALFWRQVAKHCSRLSSIENVEDTRDCFKKDPSFFNDFVDAIKASGLEWLSLAHINHIAATSILQAKDNVDSVMNDLPDKSEAQKIIQSCTKEIQQMVLEENVKLDKGSVLQIKDAR